MSDPGPGSAGLRARPPVDPAVLAVLAAAVDQVWPRPAEPLTRRNAAPVWRFSGRWWAQPRILRRERPGTWR